MPAPINAGILNKPGQGVIAGQPKIKVIDLDRVQLQVRPVIYAYEDKVDMFVDGVYLCMWFFLAASSETMAFCVKACQRRFAINP